MQKPCYILGIESSCDDTAAAILENDIVLSNVIAKQEIHVEYGGVVPSFSFQPILCKMLYMLQEDNQYLEDGDPKKFIAKMGARFTS